MTTQRHTVGEALADMAHGASAPPEAGDPLAVPLSDIPLPPPEVAREMLEDAPAAVAPARPAEMAVLDFVGDALPERTFPLKFPFRWQGERVDAVTVRQLRTGQLGDVYARLSREGRVPELMDFYAEMTGLPAAVLRAIPAVDGEPIIDAAWDFLPPSARPASG